MHADTLHILLQVVHSALPEVCRSYFDPVLWPAVIPKGRPNVWTPAEDDLMWLGLARWVASWSTFLAIPWSFFTSSGCQDSHLLLHLGISETLFTLFTPAYPFISCTPSCCAFLQLLLHHRTVKVACVIVGSPCKRCGLTSCAVENLRPTDECATGAPAMHACSASGLPRCVL